MKRIFTLTAIMLVMMLLPCMLHAQEKDKYSIDLKSEQFVPTANTDALKKSSEIFKNSLYRNKYHLTIQFFSLPGENDKMQLESAGIKLLDYIPNLAFTAVIAEDFRIDQLREFDIRALFQLSAAQKTNADVLDGLVPDHAIKSPGYADLNILTYERLNLDEVSESLGKAGAQVINQTPVFRTFTVRILKQNIVKLANLPFVQWLEFIDAPNQPENLPGRTLHRANILNDGVRNLKGNDINAAIWDGGSVSPHIDFLPAGRVTQVQTGSFSSHATHCSGTICGRGLINPFGRGMAPEAKLFSYTYNGDVQAEMAAGIPAYNLLVSSHSYNDGSSVQCGLTGTNSAYSLRSRNTDINLNNNLSHLHVHSAGNSQSSCASGWTTITGTGKSAKNNLVVAAISSTETIASFSSFGPVADGRIKPEISAMGVSVMSTYLPLNTYGTISGTSMSTPGVAGTVILLFQAYKQLNGGSLPPSSLIKNIVCNTGKDLGNPGPDYKFGFGGINALQAVKILEENRYEINTVGNAAINNTTITVPAGASRLRVMLTWNDPAGTANANPALINNLDLSVINGADITLPWKLNPASPATNATRGIDNISNIEQVTLNNPPAGVYTLRVEGNAVPVGPQQYSLTWSVDQPNIEVIYPNGNESLNPGVVEQISWDNSGVTSTQTVEYSLNNGSTWNTISSSVAATANRLAWTVPFANTSTALIRISSGALTDVSDGTFKILGTPVGLSATASTGCNSGSISFSWNAVTNATQYDIYRLDTTANFVILASDISGTSYTATGLTPGTNMWFSIVAKNNTTAAVSGRSIAINATVSSGGGGLGVIGNISGQTAVCGASSNVTYSIPPVSGATTYTWTTPAGVTITSGQSTNAITVNYTTGAQNGNFTVIAGNGLCQTTVSTLAVNVGSSSLAAPVSGGNQNQSVCPGFPTTALTATATVPIDHTVIWYDAIIGGGVISNPTLAIPGTITYYAASRNNSSGCESSARTAVTLTIAPFLQPSVTAAGPTTFCQGVNVLLTSSASTGSSYEWFINGLPVAGANAQTYTASTTGSYTVNISNGSCNTTSNPVVVTVNPLPVATISPDGPTELCEGDRVTLNASAGNSWLWSNGEITQSINAVTAGNYTVTVTDGSGCFAASSVTAVTIKPTLSVNITASPYINLYPGLTTTLSANATPPGTYSYTWFKNGIQVPGANTAVLAGIGVADVGSYTVAVNIGSGVSCGNVSAELAIADSVTGMLFIYPNPGNGQFRVNYYSPGTNVINTLKIYDSKGALVYRRNYPLSNAYQAMDVDLRFNGRGIYWAVLFDKNGKRLAAGQVVVQ